MIAAVPGVRYVGLYSIGLQAASAARSVPLYAFSPLLTRLTTTFRARGRDATAAEFDELERRWLPSVLGFGVVAVAAIGFSVPIWLGHTYVLSGITAVILLSCYIVHVGFTGMRTCTRAVGRPGLEARYSTVWTVANGLLTVPLALLAGCSASSRRPPATGAAASVILRLALPVYRAPAAAAPQAELVAYVAAAGVLTLLGELVVLHTALHGFVGLVVSGVPPPSPWGCWPRSNAVTRGPPIHASSKWRRDRPRRR